MVLLGDHVDLGAGQFLPLADTRVEPLVLLAADELGVDGDALEFAGQIGGKRRVRTARAHGKQHHTGRYAGKQSVHWFLPKATRRTGRRASRETLTNKRFIHIQTEVHRVRQVETSLRTTGSGYMKAIIHWGGAGRGR